MYGKKIAIGGKGGVGKTIICAILSQLFAEVLQQIREAKKSLEEMIVKTSLIDNQKL